ncbi:hypothetical protein ACNSPD_21430 [Yersinia enterocolitica]|uniref:hypothetical protein n=1 Tax=Yersinia TaxID=629 RepID=UPI003AB85449
MKVNYGVDFQYFPKGSSRPLDDGIVVPLSSDKNELLLLPNVGDYVDIEGMNTEYAHFNGKVKSKLFRYIRISEDEVFCSVNIVVEETDDDWGLLIKE